MQQGKCKVLIVEDNRDYCIILQDYVNLQPDMEVVGVLYDGECVLEMVLQKQPDVVLLDIIIPKADGLSVLKKITEFEFNNKPAVIILSALCQDRVTQNALSLGAVYYLIKPVDLDILIERIRNFKPDVANNNEINIVHFHKNIEHTKNTNVEEIITKLLIDVGILANLNGYHYIRTAIQMYVANDKYKISITKDVYPHIAKQFKTTPAMVERSIRSAIEKAWKISNSIFLQNVYNSISIHKNIRPSNSEFIATLSDKIRQNHNLS